MTVWIIRFLAGVLLLAAVITAVYDVTLSREADRTVMTSVGEHWGRLAPRSLRNAQEFVQRKVHPSAWEAAVRPLLLLPTWGVLAGLGFLLAYAARRRRHVNIFAN